MADKDPIAERNADIVDRLKASDAFIQKGLTEKPAGDVKPRPAARSISSKPRKR